MNEIINTLSMVLSVFNITLNNKEINYDLTISINNIGFFEFAEVLLLIITSIHVDNI